MWTPSYLDGLSAVRRSAPLNWLGRRWHQNPGALVPLEWVAPPGAPMAQVVALVREGVRLGLLRKTAFYMGGAEFNGRGVRLTASYLYLED